MSSLLQKVYNRILNSLLVLPKLVLRFFFSFNRWHLALYRERPYAQAIVEHCNERSVKSAFLEIGCGLGDILRRVEYSQKNGLDREQDVLNALQFLAKFRNAGGGSLETKQFDLTKNEVAGKYDVILLCNWIHEIEPALLKAKFEKLFQENLNTGGELIFDIVENSDYNFNHSLPALTGSLNAKLQRIGLFSMGRSVYTVKKK